MLLMYGVCCLIVIAVILYYLSGAESQEPSEESNEELNEEPNEDSGQRQALLYNPRTGDMAVLHQDYGIMELEDAVFHVEETLDMLLDGDYEFIGML
jgi:hypothetical protein